MTAGSMTAKKSEKLPIGTDLFSLAQKVSPGLEHYVVHMTCECGYAWIVIAPKQRFVAECYQCGKWIDEVSEITLEPGAYYHEGDV